MTAATSNDASSLVEETQTLINAGLESIEDATDLSIVPVIGATGAGKSTTVNYLAGSVMLKVDDPFAANGYRIETTNGVAEIGSGFTSKTILCQVVKSENFPALEGLNIVDCPGFRDSRGIPFEIAGSFSTLGVIEKSSTIKAILVVIDITSIQANRGEGLNATIKQLEQLVDDLSLVQNSFEFFITKASSNITVDNVAAALQTGFLQSPNLSANGKKLVDSMLRDDKKHLFLIDPLAADEREGLINSINSIDSIPSATVQSHFNVSLSESARRVLIDYTITDIAQTKQLLAIARSQLKSVYAKILQQAPNEKTGITLRDFITKLKTFRSNLLSSDDYSLDSFAKILLTQDGSLFNIISRIRSENQTLTWLLRFVGDDFDNSQSVEINKANVEAITQLIDSTVEDAQLSLTDKIIPQLLTIVCSAPQVRAKATQLTLDLADWTKSEEQTMQTFETQIGSLVLVDKNAGSQYNTAYSNLKENYNFVYIKEPAIASIKSHTVKYLQQSFSYPLRLSEIREGVINVTCLGDISNVSISEVIERISPIITAAGSSFRTLQVLVRGTLFLDADMTTKLFSGKNVILMCSQLLLKGTSRKIDVSGTAGKDLYLGSHAQTGSDGGVGADATHSGDIYIVCDNITGDLDNVKLLLTANGAQGGPGQQGGKGSKGLTGADGSDASKSTDKHKVDTEFAPGLVKTIYVLPGQQGEQGGKGRDGSSGGASGKSSLAGSINVYSKQDITEFVKIQNMNGADGVPGAGGEGGVGGDGGLGGYHGIKITSVLTNTASKVSDKYYFAKPNESEEFDNIWFKYPKIPDYYHQEKRANEGEQGDSGNTGTAGTKPTAAVSNSSPLSPQHLRNILYYIFFFEGNLLEFQSKVNMTRMVYDSTEFTSEFAFKMLSEVADDTKNIYLVESISSSDPIESKRRQFEFHSAFEGLFAKDPQQLSASSRAWNFIYLSVLQKMHILEQELSAKTSFGGNIVDLYSYCDYVATFVDDFKQLSKDAKIREYGRQFDDRLQQQIDSGNSTIGVLSSRIENNLDDTQQEIAHILEELEDLKEKEEENLEALKEKKKELKSKMKLMLALGVISSSLNLLGSVSGTFAIFSGLGSSVMGVAQNQANNNLQINDLQRSMDLTSKLQKANQEYGVELGKMRWIDGLSIEEQMKAANSLTEKDLNRLKVEVESSAFMSERDMLKYQLTTQLGSASEKDKENARKALENHKTDAEALFAVREAQVDKLKKDQEIRSNKKKLENLTSYSEYLKSQEDGYRKQKIARGVALTTGVSSSVISGVTSYMNTKKSYEGQIAEVEAAIQSSKENIKLLDNLTESTNTLKDDMNTKFRSFLSEAQDSFKDMDQFQIALKQLDLRNKFATMKKSMEQLASVATDTGGALVDTIDSINNEIDLQLTMYDKIEGKKDQLAMGQLIVGVASDDLSTMSTLERAYRQVASVSYLKTFALNQINSFLLFTFPFGVDAIYTAINNTRALIESNDKVTDTELVQGISDMNQAIKGFLLADLSTVQSMDKYVQYSEFIPSTPYVTLYSRDFATQFELLQVGEEAVFYLGADLNSRTAMKYITFYTDISCPTLSNEMKDNLLVTATLCENMEFALATSEGNKIYEFPQDEVTITHSALLAITENGDVDCVDAKTENRVLLKYKNNKMWTGRSPFTTLKLQLSDLDRTVNRGTAIRIEDILQDDKLTSQFRDVFGLNDDDEADLQFVVEKMFDDLVSVRWMERKVFNSIKSWDIIAEWSEISASKILQNSLQYGEQQEQSIKNMLFSKLVIFDSPQSADDLFIRLVGYGTYVYDRWGLTGDEAIEAYARWRKAE